MALVDVDLLVGLVEGLLQDGDVLVVLLALQHQLLDVALLLPQDLDGLLVTSLLLIQPKFQFVNLEESRVALAMKQV